MTTPRSTLVELLLRGKNKLRDGTRWAKGTYNTSADYDGTGKVCAVGALREAARLDLHLPVGSGVYLDAYRKLNAAARKRGGSSTEGYNDEVAESYEDVLRVYDDAISLARHS